MQLPGFKSNPKGLKRNDLHDRYLLVARDRAGAPVGYVDFNVSLFYCDDISPEEAIEDGDTADLSRISLAVRVEQLYVRKTYRRRGVATTLATGVMRVFEKELARLAKTCADIAKRLETPITIAPSLDTDYSSRSMELVHHRVNYWLCSAREDTLRVSKETTNLLVVEPVMASLADPDD
jgi:GNAT superfamily N-acetyltransferase